MKLTSLAGGLCLLAATPVAATAQVVWEGTVGADYTSGRYGGAEDVQVLYAPLGVRARTERWRVELAVPYVWLRGPDGSTSGGIVVPGGGPVTRRSGLGDVVLAGGYQLIPESPERLSLEIGGSVKLPTAGADIGTGETDYTLQVSARQPLGGRMTLTGSVGYSWLGDPAAYELEDGLTASLGAVYSHSDRASFGVLASYRDEYFIGLGEQSQINPFFTYNASGRWSMTGYGTFGLSEASPDFGAGLLLSRAF